MINKRIISIHQPNLFPWLGYFYKIFLSDGFVFLDDVQFQKTGASYTNRTSVLGLSGSQIYLTIPVSRPKGVQLINHIEIVDSAWKKKFVGVISANYSRSKYYKKNMDFVAGLITESSDNLSDLNRRGILEICNRLELNDRDFSNSSAFSSVEESTERLVNLVRCMKGDVYLSGRGGRAYMNERAFGDAGIDLNYIVYPSFEYPQVGSVNYIGGLSILDAIFNIDFVGVANLFSGGNLEVS